MDQGANPEARILPLPAAPDAIELRHLRAFAAVADELNFARAAARLYVSAPALSRQIRGLERLVGCDLFRRSSHRVELTLAGEALLDRTRRLLADLDDAVVQVRAMGGELTERMARLWGPAGELGADFDLKEMRDACERLLGQSELPPEVSVRPVSAAGLPCLVLSVGIDLTASSLPDPGSGATLPMTRDQALRLAGYYLDGHPADDPLVAPLQADLTGLPPLLVQAGTGDPLLPDARRLAEHARHHGVDVTLELYPVGTHVFHLFWSFLPEAADALAKVGAFTRRQTRGGSEHVSA